jgi:phosphoglycolate phosphatase
VQPLIMIKGNPHKAVIFDLDGTLIDSAPSILASFAGALKDEGVEPLVPLTERIIGPPLRQTLEQLTGWSDPAALDRLAAGFKTRYDSEGYRTSRVYDGVEQMLSALSDRGVTMAIATNKRRAPTVKILEHFGWQRHFRMVGTLDTASPAHPDKGTMIAFLLGELSLDPQQSLYIGDTRGDGDAASANGVEFWAANWGYGAWERASLPANWRLLESPAEILERLSA